MLDLELIHFDETERIVFAYLPTPKLTKNTLKLHKFYIQVALLSTLLRDYTRLLVNTGDYSTVINEVTRCISNLQI